MSYTEHTHTKPMLIFSTLDSLIWIYYYYYNNFYFSLLNNILIIITFIIIIVKKGAPHRQAIAVAASIDIDNNKEVTAAGDDYEASKISKNKKSTKQEELESVLNLSKWSSQIGADDDDEGLDDW